MWYDANKTRPLPGSLVVGKLKSGIQVKMVYSADFFRTVDGLSFTKQPIEWRYG